MGSDALEQGWLGLATSTASLTALLTRFEIYIFLFIVNRCSPAPLRASASARTTQQVSTQGHPIGSTMNTYPLRAMRSSSCPATPIFAKP